MLVANIYTNYSDAPLETACDLTTVLFDILRVTLDKAEDPEFSACQQRCRDNSTTQPCRHYQYIYQIFSDEDRNTTANPDWTVVQANQSRVIIYVNTQNLWFITDEPIRNLFDLVSNIGGSIGVFTGASVLS